MKMPIGKFKGQSVEAMTTQYLCWLVTQDNIRFKQWPLIKEALRVLRSRDFDGILGELKTTGLPPDRRPTPEKRKAEKAEKLRELEQRRAEEKAQRQAERRAARIKEELAMSAAFLRARQGEPPGVLDASYYVRQARQQKPADPNDVSDLL